MKYRDLRDLMLEMGIKLNNDTGLFKGLPIRYLEDSGKIQIGEKDFDRWSNSVDLEFDIWLPKGQRQFLKWAANLKER